MRSLVTKVVVTLAVAGAAVAGLAGCSGTSATPEASETEAAAEGIPVEEAVIIDVRTPEEYAEGHLEGALNLDLNSGQFEAAIPDLDPDQAYLIYCRSGNRSGQAQTLLHDAGFASVVDLGSLQDAAGETGLPIVQ